MKVWKKQARVATALALSAGLVLSGCGSDADSSSGGGDDFNLVAVLATSGPLSEYGEQSRNALETGIKILNEGNGIDGRQVKLTVVDSTGDAAKGVAALQAYLADNDKPDAVFGGQYSFEALPLAPIVTQAGLLNVSSSITPDLDDPETFPTTFQQSIPIATVIGVLAEHIAGEGYKTVGYAAVDDESGHSAVEAFEAVAASNGLTVEPAYLPADSVDATAVLEKLRAKNPDVLVLNANGAAASTLLKSRADIGWDVPTIGEGTAFAANDLGKISEPTHWKNVTVQSANWMVAGSPMLETDAFKKFLDLYKQDHEITVGMGGLVCLYQNLITVKAAYEEADGDDAKTLAAALQNLGPNTIPDSIKDLWIGPDGLGFSAERHSNQAWGASDFSFVPAQALVDGMATANP